MTTVLLPERYAVPRVGEHLRVSALIASHRKQDVALQIRDLSFFVPKTVGPLCK